MRHSGASGGRGPRVRGGSGRGPGYRRGHRPAHPPSRPEESPLSEPTDPSDGAVGASRDAAASPPVRRRTRLLLLLALGVLLADLVSKLLVVATIAPGEDVRVLGGLLYLTHTRNTGAAFSFAEGFTIVFTFIAVAVSVVIVRTARRLGSTGWAIALGMVLGGALGNLVDRVFRAPGPLRGGVVDFLSVLAPDGRVYPVFNLADSAIVCGGILGALLALRGIDFDGSRSSRDGSAARG